MFSYVDPYSSTNLGFNQSASNPFETAPPQQQQQQGGMNPLQGLQMYNQIAGGGQGGFMGIGGGGGGAASGSAAGSAAGGAGTAGGGAGSMLASAGPWAALAAVIIGNETAAKKAGRRSEDDGQYAQDLITGKVLTQDAPYYSKKLFGDDDLGLGGDMQAGADLLTLDFSNAWDTFKDQGTLSKILDLF